ncbi:MAG: hypothetical protein JW774_13060 [Candidatus Aureabacteria bacterium]|nr:hypothetical protein [Candidatus Auribacterota bacterium]
METKKKIGELLIEAGKIREEDLAKALEKQKTTGKKLGEILIQMGNLTEEDLTVSLATQFQCPFLKIENYDISKDTIALIPKGLALKYQCIPLDKIGDIISFVICDPGTLQELKQLEAFLNCKVQFFVTTPSSMKETLKKYYGEST